MSDRCYLTLTLTLTLTLSLTRCFHAHGGDVVSFSGDAMTVLFEVRDRDRDDRALRGKG